jgi:hypothetical protein
MTLFGYTVIRQAALDNLRRVLREEQQKAARTLFLLQNGTLRDAPKSQMEAAMAVTRYVYIHPKTAASIGFHLAADCNVASVTVLRPGKQTQWIFTELMPEGTAIHTNNLWE